MLILDVLIEHLGLFLCSNNVGGPPIKRFMLRYCFPPLCIDEVGKCGGLNRREVGHDK
jgi:polyribonucleotide nucleotidyltransferase